VLCDILFCLNASLTMWSVQHNYLLVEFQGGANSFVISDGLCSLKEMWHSTFVSPYIYASNHKPEILDTFLLTFHLDPSVLSYILFCFFHCTIEGRRESVVGIETRYWLDGPGIEYRWGQGFPNPSRPALRPTQLPVKWVRGVFPVSKAAVAWR
jgi:hypothetical protein